MLDEKKRKRKIGEEMERLDVLGQESDKKAVKWVQEDTNKHVKQAKSEEANQLDTLYSKRRTIITYKEELARILYQRLLKNVWPKGYRFMVKITPKGVEVNIKNALNKWYGRGIKVTGIPEYDLNAAIILVIQADNTLAVSENEASSVNGKIVPHEKKGKLWTAKS